MRKIHVFPFVAFLLLTGCVSQAAFDTKAKEADTLVALSDNLQGQVNSLTAEVDALKKQQDGLQQERDALQTEKEAVEKERDMLREKTGDLSQKAEKAEQLERATQTYQDLQKKLEKEIQEGKVQTHRDEEPSDHDHGGQDHLPLGQHRYQQGRKNGPGQGHQHPERH